MQNIPTSNNGCMDCYVKNKICEETMNELIDQFTIYYIGKKCTNSMNTLRRICHITTYYYPENQLKSEKHKIFCSHKTNVP